MSERPTATILPPEGAFPPCAVPIVVVDDHALVPHPLDGHVAVALREGVHIAWAPVAGGGVLLPMFFGRDAALGVAVSMTRDGFRAMIADLQSIEAQL
jgi:hypothetical protein